MNGFLGIALGLLVGIYIFMGYLTQSDLPRGLILWGLGLTAVFFLLNWTLASVALVVEETGVLLTSLIWRKRLPFAGSTIEKIIRPVGIVGIRIRSANGDKLWLSASWFDDFDRLHRDMEKCAIAKGGKATLVGR